MQTDNAVDGYVHAANMVQVRAEHDISGIEISAARDVSRRLRRAAIEVTGLGNVSAASGMTEGILLRRRRREKSTERNSRALTTRCLVLLRIDYENVSKRNVSKPAWRWKTRGMFQNGDVLNIFNHSLW